METTLHQYLKEATRATHNSAEAHPFQGALANAQLPLPVYVSYLQQLQALHAGFEKSLAEATERDRHLKQLMRPEYYQAQYLDRDLAELKAGSAPPLTCVKEFVGACTQSPHPVSMLGVLYVLLGAKHGGKYIAHNIKKGYELNEAGYTYFAPFGEKFQAVWQQFTSALNELDLTQEEREATLKAASDTFDVFGSMGADIWDQMKLAR